MIAYCPRCGTARAGEHRFCANCGFDYSTLATASAQPAIGAQPVWPSAQLPQQTQFVQPQPSPYSQPPQAPQFGQVQLPGPQFSPPGQQFLPPAQQFLPPAQPPYVPAPLTPGQAKPLSFQALVFLMCATAGAIVIGALDLVALANWNVNRGNALWALLDLAFALICLVAAVYGLAVATQLWKLQPTSFTSATRIAEVWVILAVLAAAMSPGNALVILILLMVIGCLAGLSLASVRALFGLGPAKFWGPDR